MDFLYIQSYKFKALPRWLHFSAQLPPGPLRYMLQQSCLTFIGSLCHCAPVVMVNPALLTITRSCSSGRRHSLLSIVCAVEENWLTQTRMIF